MDKKIVLLLLFLAGLLFEANSQQNAVWIINGNEFAITKDTAISIAKLQDGLKIRLYNADAGKVEFQWYRYGGSLRQSVVSKVNSSTNTKSKQAIIEFVLTKKMIEENGSGLWELQIFSFTTNEYLKINNKDVFRINFN